MKFIKTYLPEILFLTVITLFWSWVFSVTNVGHTAYEIFMSVLLVVTFNLCAFIAFHIAWKSKRMKNDAATFHDLLLIIKPDGMEHSSEVLKEMETCGKLHDLVLVPELPREQLEEHYSHIKDKPFFEPTMYYMMSGPVIMGILTCDNESDVVRARALLGATNPEKARENTLRGRFGTVEGDTIKNVAHLSDSFESGEHEIDIWKDILFRVQPTIVGRKIESHQ